MAKSHKQIDTVFCKSYPIRSQSLSANFADCYAGRDVFLAHGSLWNSEFVGWCGNPLFPGFAPVPFSTRRARLQRPIPWRSSNKPLPQIDANAAVDTLCSVVLSMQGRLALYTMYVRALDTLYDVQICTQGRLSLYMLRVVPRVAIAHTRRSEV